ncbi:hypothetical protein NLJ89_g9568 [Agrocybe chaxingu]|uniref:Uncharacterized protein n=1 Tax=Agrocybe chaxingu TaxID=84603 RepID=A0A9W8JST2_9AGAR|nr:hypothetical protein NLJ89_g9568 [Agrocybe chaxingu]
MLAFLNLDNTVLTASEETGLAPSEILRQWRFISPVEKTPLEVYHTYFHENRAQELQRLGRGNTSSETVILEEPQVLEAYRSFKSTHPENFAEILRSWYRNQRVARLPTASTTGAYVHAEFLRHCDSLDDMVVKSHRSHDFETMVLTFSPPVDSKGRDLFYIRSTKGLNAFLEHMRVPVNELQDSLEYHLSFFAPQERPYAPESEEDEKISTSDADESNNHSSTSSPSRKRRLEEIKEKLEDDIGISFYYNGRFQWKSIPKLLYEQGYGITNWPEAVPQPNSSGDTTLKGLGGLRSEQRRKLFKALQSKADAVQFVKLPSPICGAQSSDGEEQGKKAGRGSSSALVEPGTGATHLVDRGSPVEQQFSPKNSDPLRESADIIEYQRTSQIPSKNAILRMHREPYSKDKEQTWAFVTPEVESWNDSTEASRIARVGHSSDFEEELPHPIALKRRRLSTPHLAHAGHGHRHVSPSTPRSDNQNLTDHAPLATQGVTQYIERNMAPEIFGDPITSHGQNAAFNEVTQHTLAAMPVDQPQWWGNSPQVVQYHESTQMHGIQPEQSMQAPYQNQLSIPQNLLQALLAYTGFPVASLLPEGSTQSQVGGPNCPTWRGGGSGQTPAGNHNGQINFGAPYPQQQQTYTGRSGEAFTAYREEERKNEG